MNYAVVALRGSWWLMPLISAKAEARQMDPRLHRETFKKIDHSTTTKGNSPQHGWHLLRPSLLVFPGWVVGSYSIKAATQPPVIVDHSRELGEL